MDDILYERQLDRKARRFGMAVAAYGALILVFSVLDPTLVGVDFRFAVLVRLVDGSVALALIVEGLRRVALGRATRDEEEGILANHDREMW